MVPSVNEQLVERSMVVRVRLGSVGFGGVRVRDRSFSSIGELSIDRLFCRKWSAAMRNQLTCSKLWKLCKENIVVVNRS